MKIYADMHTHTVISGHSYSTLRENCVEAKELGHIAIALTDHAPAISGAPQPIYFMAQVPKTQVGIRVLAGVEVNLISPGKALQMPGSAASIEDWDGFAMHNGFDLPDWLLERKEYVIASMHNGYYIDEGYAGNTERWLRVLDNPNVDCIGHIGQEAFPCDYETIIKKCVEKNVLLEINNHSFEVREGSAKNCGQVARLCKKYGARIVVSSDAHNAEEVGRFPHSLALLEEVGFPEELVVNSSPERLKAYFAEKGVVID